MGSTLGWITVSLNPAIMMDIVYCCLKLRLDVELVDVTVGPPFARMRLARALTNLFKHTSKAWRLDPVPFPGRHVLSAATMPSNGHSISHVVAPRDWSVILIPVVVVMT